ncbi:DNA repair protein Nse1 [Coccidioides immitis RS]|uniref:Non-structural maintenance of chromosomes element 1 homolog n=4 Tax=Coccidioides immitis TaxID=5501 RepID=A0A0D8JTZ9_COCIM|nr:DNA repair protein Nse1 [Coccidioides immitis RS]KJF60762.1 DNA repair protein Nse1 [Coccidioides immitis RS]KMU77046.1 hypothetical protein CISG_06281 [Coccidioides immitis RMSCC 3703]KMU90462.1 hypothetical protein CIHG_08351 [Coccidioides immitis H538.4]TPX22377.1 hypothetical protein DIZ76_014248 [Coccidioides immitis]
MPVAGDENYDNSHRAFLQALMARSTMTLNEAKPILAAILSVKDGREVLPEDVTQADLSNYISSINTAISPFDFEIRNSVHQTNHTRVYALVNTTSDPLMQLATTYTADEIAYVKRLLDAMFETNNTLREEAMVVSAIKAVQLAKVSNNNSRRESQSATQGGNAQPLSMREAEDMLQRLVDEGWFEKSRKGNYSLTPRALMELRTWLIESYNDDVDEDEQDNGRRHDKIKFCFACKDLITVGQRCSQRQCPARLHNMCVQNFFRLQRAETCPFCKTNWTENNFVGERALSNQASRGAAGAAPRTSLRTSTPMDIEPNAGGFE